MSSFNANSVGPAGPDPSVGPVDAPSLADAIAGNDAPSYDQMLTEFSDPSGTNSIEAEASRLLSESEVQDAGASPADEPEVVATPQVAPAAPQLDPVQAMLWQEIQAGRQAAATRDTQFAQILQALAPKAPAAPPIDPFADLPEKYNTPEIKEFLAIAKDKILAPFQGQLEQRIQAAQHERLTNQYASEAEAAATAVINSGYDLSGNDAAIVKDGLRDFALTLSHVHGGSPSQYKDALARVADSLVRGRQAHMNKSAKAKVANIAARPATPQHATPGMVPGQQQSAEYTAAEARAAGYRDHIDAIFDGGKKVLAMRARQGRG